MARKPRVTYRDLCQKLQASIRKVIDIIIDQNLRVHVKVEKMFSATPI